MYIVGILKRAIRREGVSESIGGGSEEYLFVAGEKR